MKGKTVEQSDLIGDIKDFPIEVVQRMVNEQVRQGKQADVKVFQRTHSEPASYGVFYWDGTVDGFDFWEEVISRKNFDLFFSKYPKIQSRTEQKSINIEIPDGYEIDNDKSTFTNIVFKPIACKYPKSWEDSFLFKDITGFYVEGSSIEYAGYDRCSIEDKSVLKTKKQAESALAYAQLTQLMALPCYNGDWTPNWDDPNQQKYCITRMKYNIVKLDFSGYFSFLAFKSEKVRDEFYHNHMDLIKQFHEL